MKAAVEGVKAAAAQSLHFGVFTTALVLFGGLGLGMASSGEGTVGILPSSVVGRSCLVGGQGFVLLQLLTWSLSGRIDGWRWLLVDLVVELLFSLGFILSLLKDLLLLFQAVHSQP